MKKWFVLFSGVFFILFYTIALSSGVACAQNTGQDGAEQQKSNKTVTLPEQAAKGEGQKKGHEGKTYGEPAGSDHPKTVTLPHHAAKGKGKKTGHESKTYLVEHDQIPHHAWMEYQSDDIGNRMLRDIAMPGSHDAGMNEDDRHNCHLASECNTVTQTLDMVGQLERGSRYFDIRPMVQKGHSAESWCTAHFANTDVGFVGCEGECKLSIVNALKNFYLNGRHANELVILNISHYLRHDGNHELDGAQKRHLVENLRWHLDEILVKCDDNCNLMTMTLNEILEKGNVILLVAGMDSDKERGIFHWSQLPVYDEYANTNDYVDMREDQWTKLQSQHDRYSSQLFLLSWTLTLSSWDAFWCPVSPSISILNRAWGANVDLNNHLYYWVRKGWISRSKFPNIIYVDAYDTFAADAAHYLNSLTESVPIWHTNTAGHPGAYYTMQDDGNFAIFDKDDTLLWASNTYGHPGAELVMQGDGNLVIYDQTVVPLWATMTNGHPGAYYKMQDDGNFVIYDKDGTPIWATMTNGHPGAYYKMQDDGNFVIYEDRPVPIWHTNTAGHPGAYYKMQDDGNFVIYAEEPATALWSSHTEGHPGASYAMQDDGNFVIRDRDGTPIWATMTNGHPGAYFKMQEDGNFVIYEVKTESEPLWQSGTSTGAYYKMQDDGNFVIYDKDGTALWGTYTHGHPGAYYKMQDDGNFVIYDKDGTALWSSHTNGHPGAKLVMKDGNLVIYDAVPIWHTNTAGHPGAYFKMQPDGNFVIYDDVPIWATMTNGNPGAYFKMQDDGDFVIYDKDGTALWATYTHGHPGAYYKMQDDGNFVIYQIQPVPIWHTNTAGHDGAYYAMQDDGNFVIYGPAHVPIWSSGTYGYQGAYYRMQDDGNFVIYSEPWDR